MLKLKKLIAIALFALLPAAAIAQSSPGLTKNQVPTAGQWNSYFAAKQDVLGFTPMNAAGGTFSGRVVTAPPGASTAGVNLTPGSAPGSPADGDMWMTSAGMYIRVNGSTIGPLGASTPCPTCALTNTTNNFTAAQTITGASLDILTSGYFKERGFSLRIPISADAPTGNSYVATTGADTNNCFNVGFPCATLQRAYDNLANYYDLQGITHTINIADGTYTTTNTGSPQTGCLVTNKSIVGQNGPPGLKILGNGTTPSNVVLKTINGDCINIGSNSYGTAQFVIGGVRLTTTGTGGNLINQSGGGSGIVVGTTGFAFDYGQAVQDHVITNHGSWLIAGANNTISGTAYIHAAALSNSTLALHNTTETCTITTSPNNATPFVSRTLTAATWAATGGGQATFTTSVAHGIPVGAYVQVVGVTPSGYNGNYQTITGTTGSTVVVAQTVNPGGAGTVFGTLAPGFFVGYAYAETSGSTYVANMPFTNCGAVSGLKAFAKGGQVIADNPSFPLPGSGSLAINGGRFIDAPITYAPTNDGGTGADLSNCAVGQTVSSQGPATAMACRTPAFLTSCVTINFTTSNTDHTISLVKPTTNYQLIRVYLANANGSLTAATLGIFSAVGGGGTAIAPTAAVTVSTAAANTANNFQTVFAGSTNTFYDFATLYARVGTGTPAFGTVCAVYSPIP